MGSLSLASLIFLFALLETGLFLAIDNGIEGDPEIDCGPSSISVNFNTRNAFEGSIFVKGLFSDSDCRTTEGGGRVTGINIPFGSCNVRRTRSLNPRGVFVGATVIISFHPQFITMGDKAYSVQCFYMEADKTVSQEMEVSMLTTGFATQNVPMPKCSYQILDGPGSSPIQYAYVGQTVYHKWTCDTETTDVFCMRVHSCYVDDGAGDKVDLLDQDGCAQDRYLIANLEYLTDLMAGQSTMVFKYADRAQLFFQCQITITIKEPENECPRPTCSEPQRGKRSLANRSQSSYLPSTTLGVTDVSASFDSIGLGQPMPEEGLSSENTISGYKAFLSTPSQGRSEAVCLSRVVFGLSTAIVVLLLASSLASAAILYIRR